MAKIKIKYRGLGGHRSITVDEAKNSMFGLDIKQDLHWPFHGATVEIDTNKDQVEFWQAMALADGAFEITDAQSGEVLAMTEENKLAVLDSVAMVKDDTTGAVSVVPDKV